MKEKLLLLLYGAIVSIATLHISEERMTTEPVTVDISVYERMEIDMPEENEAYTPINIPVEEELQEWIYTYCIERNISPALVMAIIEKESNYNAGVIGDTGNSYGLMQIYKNYHTDRMERLGITDLLDAKQNVQVGVDYLQELFGDNQEPEWVLNAYNGGRAYANRKEAAGEDTKYSIDVLSRAAELERLWEYAGN